MSDDAHPGWATPSKPAKLTKRQMDIARLLSEGRNTPEVAAMLGIAPSTIKNHMTNVYRKLGIETDHGAAARKLAYWFGFHDGQRAERKRHG